MSRQFKWDMRFLHLAQHVSTYSKDPSTCVGSVIVRPDNSVCSIGFNGFPMDVKDTEERLNNRELKLRIVIHAEINAAIFAREEIKGYTLFNYPFQPCAPCSSFFIQKGIKRIVAPYSDNPRWKDDFVIANEILREAGVEVKLYTEVK